MCDNDFLCTSCDDDLNNFVEFGRQSCSPRFLNCQDFDGDISSQPTITSTAD